MVSISFCCFTITLPSVTKTITLDPEIEAFVGNWNLSGQLSPVNHVCPPFLPSSFNQHLENNSYVSREESWEDTQKVM